MRHLAALFLALPMMVSGQTFVDMNVFYNYSPNIYPNNMTIDDEGNLYISGSFDSDWISYGGIVFDQYNLTDIGPQQGNGYIAKLDPDLDVLWAKDYRSVGDIACRSIAMLDNGNLFVGLSNEQIIENGDTLSYSEGISAVLDPMGVSLGHRITGPDPQEMLLFGGDTFLTKAQGEIRLHSSMVENIWTFPQDLGFQGYLSFLDIAIDGSGHIFAVGYFQGNLTIGSNILPGNGSAYQPIAMMINPDGTLGWMRTFDTPDACVFRAACTTANDGLVIGGSFHDWIIDANGDTVHAIGTDDMMLAKLDLDGNLVTMIFGGCSVQNQQGPAAFDDFPREMIAGRDGSFYTATYFYSVVGTEPRINNIPVPSWSICKFSNSLDLLWVKESPAFHTSGGLRLALTPGGDLNLFCRVGITDWNSSTFELEGMVDTLPCQDCGILLVATLHDDTTMTSVSGRVYVDMDQNGVYNSGDVACAQTPVMADDVVFTGSTGQYMMGLNAGPHTISCTPPLHFVASPSSVALNVPLNTPQMQNVDIRLLPDGNITDLKVRVGSPGVPIPGFDNSYQVTVTNMGNVATGGTVTANLPAGYSYLSATPLPAQVTGGQLTWNMAALPIMQQTAFTVQVNLPATTALGGEMVMSASVATVSTDANPTDNSATHTAIVVGAYDPNDKQAFPAGDLTEYELGEGIEYTIRFQNTGTWPAQNVRLVDTISHLLDVTTIRTIGASHAQTMTHRPGNVVEWLFPSINLPDSSVDQAASQGFVTFHIRPAAGVGLGTTIANQAAIYFDFNAPIITNEVVQSVVTAIAEPLGLRSMMLYPNPATRSVRIDLGQADALINSVEFIDLTGRKVFTAKGPITSGSPIDVSALQEGIYLVNVCPEGMEPIVDRMVLMR